MTRFLLTLLAAVSLTLASLAAAAPDTRARGAPHHAAHAGSMAAAAASDLACGAEQPCGPAAAVMCKFVCAGAPTPERGAQGLASLAAPYANPGGSGAAGLAPGLHERPPKTRLL